MTQSQSVVPLNIAIKDIFLSLWLCPTVILLSIINQTH